MRDTILKKHLKGLFTQATFGIEKEGQRVTESGEMSRSKHPDAFGSRLFHPYIQTDFAESQLELISPIKDSSMEAIRFLGAIHEVTLRHLPENELIWPMSMPASLPDPDAILEAQMAEEDTRYREYLTTKYGKYKQMVSGIHYNFGFSKAFFSELKEEGQCLADIQNQVYMKLARQFLRYQWLLVYLFGASPLAPEAYFQEGKRLTRPVRSIRSSQYGYVNDDHVNVSFASLSDYVKDLRQLVNQGELIAEKELYTSVRFRGGKAASDLIDKGIHYLEFRLFDLNPFAPYGISQEDARFIHLFLLLMIWLDEKEPHKSHDIGQKKSEIEALNHPLTPPHDLKEAQELFEEFSEMAESLGLPPDDRKLIAEKAYQLKDPSQTLGGRLWKAYEEAGSMEKLGLQLAKSYKAAAVDRPFGLKAFDKMELSTQAFLADAIQQGFHLEVLDENDQFVKLTYQGHVEYVKNGNMTSHDSYISPLIMENKVVAKKVLASSGFKVPASLQLRQVSEVETIFPLVKGKAIVIKPKSTNYGLGISIFPKGTEQLEDFTQAIQLALKEDSEVMVEDFIEGTEYRFFVLDGETKAVLLRVPANVRGDGKSTVKQLVAMKNVSPLRGDAKATPLKTIELGELEVLQLKEQGYTIDSIIPKGETVYLRANSNVSTGGDSIDMTDQVHPSYKAVAAEIARAMYAKVCGVDLIIPDLTQPADCSQESYGIIEANFNPMMMMHIFPAVGKSRRLSRDILKMLYPEYPWTH